MARNEHTPKRTDRADGRASAWIAFWLGIGVSVAANVAHTWYPTPTGPTDEQVAQWLKLSADHTRENWVPGIGAQAAAAFWPLAVLLAIEMVTRISWPEGWTWVLARYGGLGLVAAVAAVISYQHMSGLLSAYGESDVTTVVGPLAVDGLMIVASVAVLATGKARHPRARTSQPAQPKTKPEKPAETRTQAPDEKPPGYRAAVDECLVALHAKRRMPGQKGLGTRHGIGGRQGGYAQEQAQREYAAAMNGSAQ